MGLVSMTVYRIKKIVAWILAIAILLLLTFAIYVLVSGGPIV